MCSYLCSDGACINQTNQNPVAVITANLTAGMGLTADLDGTFSYDPDGSIISYNWFLGDGFQSNLSYIEHTFQVAGTYLINLTVMDNNLASGTSYQAINIT